MNCRGFVSVPFSLKGGCGFRMKAAGASVYGCRVLSVLLRVLNWKFMDGQNCSGAYLSISLGGSWIICSLVLFAVFGKFYKLSVCWVKLLKIGVSGFLFTLLVPFLFVLFLVHLSMRHHI